MSFYEPQSIDETRAIAANIAQTAKTGDVFLLEGNLGAGKSEFARGFIKRLCGESTEIPSPTFTLVQTYDSPNGVIWHFDLYRLKNAEEIFDLGWEDAIYDGIVLVEWPSRLGTHKPLRAKTIHMSVINETARRILVEDV